MSIRKFLIPLFMISLMVYAVVALAQRTHPSTSAVKVLAVLLAESVVARQFGRTVAPFSASTAWPTVKPTVIVLPAHLTNLFGFFSVK